MLFRHNKPETVSASAHVDTGVMTSGRVTYPKLYQGAVLNLLDSGGNFLGKALLRGFSIHELDLIRPEGALSLPVFESGATIHVNGSGENGESFTLSTQVAQSSRVGMKLRELALLSDSDHRNTSRFFVNRPAELFDIEHTPPGRKPPAQACILMDISMEGGRIRSLVKYELDDVFKMRIELYPNAGKISFNVQIIRVTELDNNWFEYGLLFEALPVAKRKYLAEDLRYLAERV